MSELERLVASGVVQTGVPLGPLTTYKLGGPARFLAEPAETATLAEVLAGATADGTPILVLGRGSNVVVSEDGFPGLVVRLGSGFGNISHQDSCIVAGGAVSLPKLARAAAAEGRLGLEFYVGIPGSVGGAVRQNAGCHGAETADVLIEARIVDRSGAIRTAASGDLELSYRHSNLDDTDVVTHASFSFRPGDRKEGDERIREVTRWRKEHQPGGTFNAGSVFKNPPGEAAGRIIDELGLKGHTVGGASVSTKHANFFVASPEATGTDVYRLVREVRRIVAERTGVELEPEIRFVGFGEESE